MGPVFEVAELGADVAGLDVEGVWDEDWLEAATEDGVVAEVGKIEARDDTTWPLRTYTPLCCLQHAWSRAWPAAQQ